MKKTIKLSSLSQDNKKIFNLMSKFSMNLNLNHSQAKLNKINKNKVIQSKMEQIQNKIIIIKDKNQENKLLTSYLHLNQKFQAPGDVQSSL